MKNKMGVFIVFFAFCLGMFTSQQAIAEETKLNTGYADGTHSLPFEVLKDGTNEVSATSDYMEKPAQVKIDGNKAEIILTLKNSGWWQFFKVYSPSQEEYVDVTTISEDESADTSVVSFPVDTLDQTVAAKIHIIVTGIEGFEYDNQYDIQIKLDASNLPQAPSSPPADEAPQVEEVAEPEPEQPVDEVAPKPTEQSKPNVNNTDQLPQSNETNEDQDEKVDEPTDVSSDESADELAESISDEESSNDDEEVADNVENTGETSSDETEELDEQTPSKDKKSGLGIILWSALGVIVIVAVFILIRVRKST